MNKEYININVNSSEITHFEIDLEEMESKCSVFEICDSLTRLTKYDENTYIGTIKNHELRISKNSNAAFIDNEPVTTHVLIETLIDEDEVTFLENIFNLKKEDFVSKVFLKDGTIAFKDLKGQWYKYC